MYEIRATYRQATLRILNVICTKTLKMKKHQILFLYILFQAIAVFGQDSDEIKQSGFINAHPADHLPSYIKLACGFGERPDWSHDSKFI